MPEIDFLRPLHTATKRDYVARVVEHDKAECASVAKQWGRDYWDGERHFGYGGYRYDGRWLPVARAMAEHYGLKPGMRVLDVGCGKGFLLFELTRAVPGIEVAGLDVSAYAVENGKEEIRDNLVLGDCADLPWESDVFDFVYSINTLHNLRVFDLEKALGEIERVARGGRYVCVESYRSEREKANLLYWQLTCESFYSPDEWTWLFHKFGYGGDWGFIFFE